MYKNDLVTGGSGDEYAAARSRARTTPSPPTPPPPTPSEAYSHLTPTEVSLLDRYWRVRGILSLERRNGLLHLSDVETVDSSAEADDAYMYWSLYGIQDLTGTDLVTNLIQDVLVWEASGDAAAAERIREVSRRMVDLNRLLGGEGADTAMMVFREPRILDVNPAIMVQRLVDMRMATLRDKGADTSGEGLLKMVENEPALLLQEGDVDASEKETTRSGAWKSGIVSDNDPTWESRFAELVVYKEEVGDAHVGFRAGDDATLVRWAKAQRRAFVEKRLDETRFVRLVEVGFRFKEDEAEWLRWYAELKRCQSDTGVANPDPLGNSTDYFLINWCGVQRIAQRVGRLTKEQVGLLEAIAFDWTGADPLS